MPGPRRVLFTTLGILCVALAIVGVFVPGLPTTVFVIAASYLFARSSPALDGWLRRNRWFGPALHRFTETGGMPFRCKMYALVSMWAALGLSWYGLGAFSAAVRILPVFLGLVGTAALLFYVRTTDTALPGPFAAVSRQPAGPADPGAHAPPE